MTTKKKKTKAKKAPAVKRPRGRPQKITFDDNILMIIHNLAKEGKTHKQIAEIIGVSEWTIYQYKRISEDFSQALDSGKDLADSLVEQALFSRAVGCWGKEAKTASDKGVITDVQYVDKWMPPDTKAAIFWLTNRKKSKWVERVENTNRHEFLDPVVIEDDEGTTTTLTMQEGKGEP